MLSKEDPVIFRLAYFAVRENNLFLISSYIEKGYNLNNGAYQYNALIESCHLKRYDILKLLISEFRIRDDDFLKRQLVPAFHYADPKDFKLFKIIMSSLDVDFYKYSPKKSPKKFVSLIKKVDQYKIDNSLDVRFFNDFKIFLCHFLSCLDDIKNTFHKNYTFAAKRILFLSSDIFSLIDIDQESQIELAVQTCLSNFSSLNNHLELSQFQKNLLLKLYSVSNNTDLIMKLIDYGANLYINSNLVFRNAINYNNSQLIEFLLDKQVSVNNAMIRDLDNVICSKKYNIISLLLENNLSVTNFYNSCFRFAIKCKDLEALNYLNKKGFCPSKLKSITIISVTEIWLLVSLGLTKEDFLSHKYSSFIDIDSIKKFFMKWDVFVQKYDFSSLLEMPLKNFLSKLYNLIDETKNEFGDYFFTFIQRLMSLYDSKFKQIIFSENAIKKFIDKIDEKSFVNGFIFNFLLQIDDVKLYLQSKIRKNIKFLEITADIEYLILKNLLPELSDDYIDIIIDFKGNVLHDHSHKMILGCDLKLSRNQEDVID